MALSHECHEIPDKALSFLELLFFNCKNKNPTPRAARKIPQDTYGKSLAQKSLAQSGQRQWDTPALYTQLDTC